MENQLALSSIITGHAKKAVEIFKSQGIPAVVFYASTTDDKKVFNSNMEMTDFPLGVGIAFASGFVETLLRGQTSSVIGEFIESLTERLVNFKEAKKNVEEDEKKTKIGKTEKNGKNKKK